MRIAKRFPAAVVLLLFAGGLRAQDLPRTATAQGAFAFPNPAGTRLLAVAALQQPGRIHTALCAGNRRFAVRFERRQAVGKADDGRQASRNFVNLPGSVFTIRQGTLDDGATCFLAGDALLEKATVLAAAALPKPAECSAEVRQRLTAERHRDVVSCRELAAFPANRRLLVAEFVRRDKDALASVVLLDASRAVFADYAAEYRSPGEDLWRADDGGQFDPAAFRLVFLVQRGATYTLGIDWQGPEGSSLAVFVSDGATRFAQAIGDYWYRAPL
jgi:hypothetical protein